MVLLQKPPEFVYAKTSRIRFYPRGIRLYNLWNIKYLVRYGLLCLFIGAVAGAFVYVILSQRLAVLAQSSAIDDLPAVLAIPLSEPMFILGTIFILVVLFLPGGLAALGLRARALFSRRARSQLADGERTPGDLVQEDDQRS